MTQPLPTFLSEDVITSLSTILAHLTSPDNNARAPAEQSLNEQLLSNPHILLSGLAYIAARHAIPTVSVHCCYT